ncbi:MAG: hypothetical protein MZV70_71195, partial [Desulfobacterales bacterium]|nr:hypothetical protein [Desulfobacterales bacterium]
LCLLHRQHHPLRRGLRPASSSRWTFRTPGTTSRCRSATKVFVRFPATSSLGIPAGIEHPHDNRHGDTIGSGHSQGGQTASMSADCSATGPSGPS